MPQATLDRPEAPNEDPDSLRKQELGGDNGTPPRYNLTTPEDNDQTYQDTLARQGSQQEGSTTTGTPAKTADTTSGQTPPQAAKTAEPAGQESTIPFRNDKDEAGGNRFSRTLAKVKTSASKHKCSG